MHATVANHGRQLAFTWLNHQHLQCAVSTQHIKNFREALDAQYHCMLSHTWTCVRHAITYTQSEIRLDHFCGFIDGRLTIQPKTAWVINVRPNMHIDFLNFNLYSNHWYCDYEYLKITGTTKNSTFCGSRLPWVHDASDSTIKITFFTKRLGSENYWLEFQYYGAYVPDYHHDDVFLTPSSAKHMHLLYFKQHTFESIHIISDQRLNILHFEAVNVCSRQQVVCYDGPGPKSPVLLFRYNQSQLMKCQSSTFQMVCILSRPDPKCDKLLYLHYYTMRASGTDFRKIHLYSLLKFNNVDSLGQLAMRVSEFGIGTSKYMYNNSQPNPKLMSKPSSIELNTAKITVGLPYMMHEGYGCMYGGLYIIETLSSHDSELWSYCPGSESNDLHIIVPLNNSVIIFIHYDGYSPERVSFEADFEAYNFHSYLPLSLRDVQNKTVRITMPSFFQFEDTKLAIQSYVINMRKIQYFDIKLDLKGAEGARVKFDVLVSNEREPCVWCTIQYGGKVSNVMGRQNEVEITNKAFHREDNITSVVIDMSACNTFEIPIWSLFIEEFRTVLFRFSALRDINHTYHQLWPRHHLDIVYRPFSADARGPAWLIIHMKRPQDIPHYAIWKVRLKNNKNTVLHVSIEVFKNKTPSTVYSWNHHISNAVYMTVHEAVNFLFILDYTKRDDFLTYVSTFTLSFERHYIYDDKVGPTIAAHMGLRYDISHNIR